ncbi:hypothetical protein DRO60_05395, partial [Candidatus Bathyarchaeota archaeon]
MSAGSARASGALVVRKVRYVLRGPEDEVLNALRERGTATLSGASGMGKSSTAYFLAGKLWQEGKIAIVIRPSYVAEGLRGVLVEVRPWEGEGGPLVAPVIEVPATLTGEELALVVRAILEVVSKAEEFEEALRKAGWRSRELGKALREATKPMGFSERLLKFVQNTGVIETAALAITSFLTSLSAAILTTSVFLAANWLAGKLRARRLRARVRENLGRAVLIFDDASVLEDILSVVRAIRDTAEEMGTSLPGLLFVVRVGVGDLAEYVANRPAYVREKVPVEKVLRSPWSKDNIIDLFAIGDLRTFEAVIRANRDLYKREPSEEELEA